MVVPQSSTRLIDTAKYMNPESNSDPIPESLHQSWAESASVDEPTMMDAVSSYVMSWFGFDSPLNTPSEVDGSPRINKPRADSQLDSIYPTDSLVDETRQFVDRPPNIQLLSDDRRKNSPTSTTFQILLTSSIAEKVVDTHIHL